MRNLLLLLAAATALALIQATSPFMGRADGNSLDTTFGWAALILFGVATVYGFARGPATRSVVLVIWSLGSYVAGALILGIGGPGGGPTLNTILLAISVALAILAAEEALRAFMARGMQFPRTGKSAGDG